MITFNSKKIKSGFAIFKHKKDLIYLDSAATAQKPEIVVQAVSNFYDKHNSNIHRSIYDLGEAATTLYEQSREKVAEFVNADSQEIVFTRGTTESINFVADSWGRANVGAGDNILITQAEHHANFLPWQRLAAEKGAQLNFIKLDKKSFLLETPDLDSLINPKTKLVALTYDSNVLGNIWSTGLLEKVIQKAHSVGAKVLIDVAQSIAHEKTDVKKLYADFLAFSGHKMFGPTGIGVLYIKKDLHDHVPPYQVGGSMVYSVSFAKPAVYRDAPQKFEAGTPPIAQAIGLGVAIDYIKENLNFDELRKHEAGLTKKLLDGLQRIDGCHILGNLDMLAKSGHLVSFYIDNIHAHDLSAYLSNNNIAVRSGHHCAQPLAQLLGVESSLRVSFSAYNTEQDVEVFLDKLKEAIDFFGKNL